MRWLTLLLLGLTLSSVGASALEQDKTPPNARIVITAELACMHCTFGKGESCAVCLKLDDKTPLPLTGKAAKEFEAERLSGKSLSATGTLSFDKQKGLVLASDEAKLVGDKDKAVAPPPGQTRIEGAPICGMCDLKVTEVCTLGIANGTAPILLEGKLASDHAANYAGIAATGRLFLDAKGQIRLDAVKVDLKKK